MNNTFSSQQASKMGDLYSNLLFRQYKLDLLAKIIEMKRINPKFGQNQIAKGFVALSSTLKRYRLHRKMCSPKKSHQILRKENKRPQMTSNWPQMTSN